jgi:hypothetical protein
LSVTTSGTARPFLIFVYTISDGQPKRLWTYETGDRWDYGYHNAFVKDEQLLIERYKPQIIDYQGQKHDMSSSNTYLRDYYKWNANQFKQVKTEEIPASPDDQSPWVNRVKEP